MPGEREGLLGFFPSPQGAAAAIRALRDRGFDVHTEMPASYAAVEAALARPVSRIGWITLAGAVAGALLGFALTIGTARQLPLIVGGKPIVSMPPFLVIAFELTVLGGGLANFGAIVAGALCSRRTSPVPHDPRASVDRIAVFVPDADAPVEELLWTHGAEEVKRCGGRA